MKFGKHEITDYEARAIMFGNRLIVDEGSVYEVKKKGNEFCANVIYTESRTGRLLSSKGKWFLAHRSVIEGWIGIKLGKEDV